MATSLQAIAYVLEPPVSPQGFRLMDVQNHTTAGPTAVHDSSARRDSNPSGWPDSWLINAVRREPPDEDALNALVERYWQPLYGRCRMLTLDGDSARDLAQDSWLRVLRARQSLEPDGHFQAYITTIATNLWRDMNRASLRAGPMAEGHMSSLEGSMVGDEGESTALGNVIADPHTLSPDDQLVLEIDMDHALERLDPRLRDVLTARFVGGESAAEIGRRYERTEQTISGWIREAIRQMQTYLGDERNRGRTVEVP